MELKHRWVNNGLARGLTFCARISDLRHDTIAQAFAKTSVAKAAAEKAASVKAAAEKAAADKAAAASAAAEKASSEKAAAEMAAAASAALTTAAAAMSLPEVFSSQDSLSLHRCFSLQISLRALQGWRGGGG